jgi:2-polyprenyl-6-methoxyphenol hydroxylase-like FAD-dependent oxidoreductase
VGAGLALQPNAMKALALLGLDGALAAQGAVAHRAAILDDRGRPLGAAVDIDAISKEAGALTVAIHRARLHRVLLDAAGDVVRLGTRVLGYESSDHAVEVRLEGATLRADLLVGADGLHSAVRAQMLGAAAPVYAGYTSWRGVTTPGALAPPDGTSESWGRGLRFGMVGVGHGEIYWFAVANAPPGGKDGDVHAALLARFGDWHRPVRATIEATPVERIVRTDIADRPPVTQWHTGRVVLLGDAAHPMTPNLGQGACQAIEDAVVLDRCLQDRDVERALLDYEARRVARANGMVVGARRMGAVAQWQNPLAVGLRNVALRRVPSSLATAQLRKMVAFQL